jgi:hypothetical protein
MLHYRTRVIVERASVATRVQLQSEKRFKTAAVVPRLRRTEPLPIAALCLIAASAPLVATSREVRLQAVRSTSAVWRDAESLTEALMRAPAMHQQVALTYIVEEVLSAVEKFQVVVLAVVSHLAEMYAVANREA